MIILIGSRDLHRNNIFSSLIVTIIHSADHRVVTTTATTPTLTPITFGLRVAGFFETALIRLVRLHHNGVTEPLSPLCE